jgi:hypothetical protein
MTNYQRGDFSDDAKRVATTESDLQFMMKYLSKCA